MTTARSTEEASPATDPRLPPLAVTPLPELPPDGLDVDGLDALGFRPLGVLELVLPGGAPRAARVHVARYGDAFAFADPLDPRVGVRFLSVLRSGALVETRLAGPLVGEGPRPVTQLRWLYRDRPGLGVHRQTLDVADLPSLWLAHRGFVRRVDDEVPDHGALDLCAAALHRAWHVQVAVDLPDLRLLGRASRAVRDLLLVLPVLLGLAQGLTWWASALLAGVPAVGALLVLGVVDDPTRRPWLLAAPLVILLPGWLTVGWVGVAGVLAYALVVAKARERWLPDAIVAVSALLPGRSEPAPRPLVD